MNSSSPPWRKSNAANPLVLPPSSEHHERWLSTAEFARQWHRSLRTVQRWCETGYVLDFGIRCYKDPLNRWWLLVSE